MKIIKKHTIRLCCCLIALVGLLVGCSQFLEIDPPSARINSETVFRNQGTAIGAVTGLYNNAFHGFANGGANSVGLFASMSADELIFQNVGPSIDVSSVEINLNSISPDNSGILSLWANMYNTIYGANRIIEKTTDNPYISKSLLSQLKGEALFIRSFAYFYLVNLFGDVPLITATDYQTNAVVGKSGVQDIYAEIVRDLEEAVQLLSPDYQGAERLRVNKWAAVSFLARVELYRQNWPRAYELSTSVLEQTHLYLLAPDLNEVFLTGSTESIWQRASLAINQNTAEATIYLTNNEHYLTNDLLGCFHPDDLRVSHWVWRKDEENDVFVPYKYKSVSQNVTTEHAAILRLAEQYLIRAEALAMQGRLDEAVNDLDAIRSRAGLPMIGDINPTIEQRSLVDSTLLERQRELFTEWGHRWFDLKRKGIATEVLVSTKPGFTAEDEWYPIPESEKLKNPNLN